MNNSILRNAIVTIGSFIFVVSVVSAWSAPGATAPGGNVSAPITVGPTWQIRQGDLTLASTTVSGVLNSTGGIIGTTVVADTIVTTKRVQVGNTTQDCTAPISGSLRWTGTAFEGCNGTAWSPLTTGGGTPATCPPPSTSDQLKQYLAGAVANISRDYSSGTICGTNFGGANITMNSNGQVTYGPYTYHTVVPSCQFNDAYYERTYTYSADTTGIHGTNGDFYPWTSIPKQATWCQ